MSHGLTSNVGRRVGLNLRNLEYSVEENGRRGNERKRSEATYDATYKKYECTIRHLVWCVVKRSRTIHLNFSIRVLVFISLMFEIFFIAKRNEVRSWNFCLFETKNVVKILYVIREIIKFHEIVKGSFSFKKLFQCSYLTPGPESGVVHAYYGE